MPLTIRYVAATEFAHDQSGLIELLRDAVDAGASVGFLPPLPTAEGQAYWQEVGTAVAAGTTLLLVAENDGQLVGTVQLVLATKPNGLHRAEVSKLLVHSSAQRRGIGRQLMLAVEKLARQHNRSTLVLDTLQGAGSELLYQGLGYTAAGAIPAFARVPSGALEPTVVYYKLLG
ncbi:GNAT family N-acetyltransferase [Hymenobacter pini]|uniref:GNAT family N-acetyltransferase n=1 Tax=Hymenobacter pini TaxID=2880879 RepID=UPI001CF55F27|nr:GNAT family N-acetyltransferase [Hymenobacter pini]MCA8831852.1 GNAT family N-acetyltransferase [Hymenobacter pini]